jgi:hypothetical protein
MEQEYRARVISLKDKDLWNSLLRKLPLDQQDVYFTPEYYNVYEKNSDGKAQCFVYEKDGELALYPFLLNSVNQFGYDLDQEYYDIEGCYGYNGVLSSSYEEKFITDFYAEFDIYCIKNNIIAEFVRFHPLIKNQLFSKNNVSVFFNRNTVSLSNEKSIDMIYQSFSNSCKRAIKKSVDEGLSVEIVDNANHQEVEMFNEVYKENMDRVGSTDYLYFNFEYFNNLSIVPGAKILKVKKDNEIVALFFCLFNDYYAHYHLGCSRTNFLQFRPNNFLYFEFIKFALEIGCKKIHFGGGRTNKDDDSLLRFKSSFSDEKEDFYIGKKIRNKKIYDEVIRQWEIKYVDLINNNNNIFLKYKIQK